MFSFIRVSIVLVSFAPYAFCAQPSTQLAQPTTNDVLRIVHTWFTDAHIASLGAQGCIQKVEQELRAFKTSAASAAALSSLNAAQTTAAIGALENRFIQQFQGVSGAVNHLIDLQVTQLKNGDKAQRMQELIFKDQTLIKAGGDSLQGLSIIASALGKGKFAQQLSCTGGFALKFAENALLINSAKAQLAAGTMSTSASNTAVAGGWIGIGVGLIGMISSLCSDDEQNDGFQAIFEAIGQLSKQMHEYHVATMQAFAGMHDHLQAQDRFMLENFFELRTGQHDIKQKLREMSRIARRMNYALRGNVGYVSHLLQSHHQQMTGNLESLRVERILDLVQESAQLCKERRIPTEIYKQYLAKLLVKGINRAKEPYVTGDTHDESSATAVCLALPATDWHSNLWAHPAFSNVNLLGKYGKRFFKLSHDPLVNPLIWAHCADAIARLVSKKITDPEYPQDTQAKENDLKLLADMEHEGTRFVEFTKAFGQKIDSFAHDYAQGIDEFSAHVQHEVQVYEAKRTQELQAEVAKKGNEEMAQFQDAAASCPNVIRVTNEAVALMSRQAVQVKPTGKAFVVRPSAWCDGVITDYAHTLLDETNKSKLVEVCHTKKQPMNYDAFLAQEKKKHLERMQTHLQALIPLSAVRITQDANALVAQKLHLNSVSSIMIPKSDCGYTSILPVPGSKTPIQETFGLPSEHELIMEKIKGYAIREQQGLGFIHYEYEPKPSNFTICAYFTDRAGLKTHILTVTDPSFKPSPLYGNEENLVTWWHGGRYSKAQDKISTAGFRRRHESQLGLPRFLIPHKAPQPLKEYYYPLVEGYQGAKDVGGAGTTCTAVAQADLAQRTCAAQAKERVRFTNNLIAQVQPSANSKAFKALQTMDMRHKTLDCALVLAHNKNMFAHDKLRKEFADFYATSNELVCDMRSMLKYLESYSTPGSVASLKPYELPQLLQRTKQTKSQALQAIKGLKLAPQCAKISSAVSRLAQLRQVYTDRVMPAPQRAPASAAAPSAATAAHVTALQADNKRLTDMVNGLQQQMATMLALLQDQQRH